MTEPRPQGQPRTDAFLVTDEVGEAARVQLGWVGLHLWRAVMASAAPASRDICARMRVPQPGDLVIEWMTMHQAGVPVGERRHNLTYSVGYLVDYRIETFKGDSGDIVDEWQEDAWYVQYGPNPDDVVRWTNCEFLALPLAGEAW